MKSQAPQNVEVWGFRQSELSGSTTTITQENKSTVQSETHSQNADKSLVDLTIDPISPMGETGQALFESTSAKSTTDKERCEKAVSNEIDEEIWKLPMYKGSDSEH